MSLSLFCVLCCLVLASGPTSGAGTSSARRFIQLSNGQTVPNPEYKKEPVISNLKQLNEYKTTENGKDIALDAGTERSFNWFKEEIKDVAMNPTECEDELAKVFQEFEIPIGLLNKCMGLQTFDAIEFIIDDSSSMASGSKSHGTRWDEAFARIEEMLKIALHFLVPPIHFRLLNSRDTPEVLERQRQEKSPEFLERARSFLEKLKTNPNYRPGGTMKLTPLRETIATSFQAHQGSRVARFIFADGQPNRRERDVKEIIEMVKNRNNPHDSPITMFSVSDYPADTAWMRQLDEAAPFCDEKSLYDNEVVEVESNQGEGFPYTYGFHLVCCLVGANNPFDLDALDETVPLLKKAFFTLIGVVEQKRYDIYWEGFIKAQQNCRGTTNADQYRKTMNWQPHRHLFENANSYDEILAVGTYKNGLQQRLNY